MGRSTVHYADSETNNILKRLHNKLRPAGTPVERVEYIIELLLLRIFEAKIKQDESFTSLRKLFEGENYRLLFSHLLSLNGEQILSELNKNIFPFYSTILSKARTVTSGNLPQKMQDQLVLMEEVFANSNFTNNVKGGVIAEVIGMVNEIDEKYILKTDLLGDAIESALSETGGTKDLGLYRTPDHIRKMMVEMVDPDFSDTIFDPACGTAGFLFDAYDYVIEKARQTRQFPAEHIANMFYRTGIGGIEYQGRIRKMAAVNMYIRGLNPHNIEQGDSLKLFDPPQDAGSKSVVIANPPFGAERDQPAYPNVWEEYSKESETTILFVKLMFDLLRDKGRCAVVVSEGFLTWGQNSACALRKMLLNETNLRAVISLPQGVFVSKSGQGAKTSILYFEKGSPTDFVWHYKITNDGFSMGTNRKEIEGSQIPELLELFKQVKQGLKPSDTKHSYCISKEQIETLDPRIIERISKEVTEKTNEKNAAKRAKLVSDLNLKLSSKKISKAIYDERLIQFDNIIEGQIGNEVAKAIEKAHSYHFNLQNYRSNLGAEQIADWHGTLKGVEVQNSTGIEIRYKNLNQADPTVALQILASFNPQSALDMDLAREFLSKLGRDSLEQNDKLMKLKELLRKGYRYPMVSLRDLIIINDKRIKPSVYPETEFTLLGVSNQTGVFINERLKGKDIKQSYFKVDKNQSCYNPYRINVGSIGLCEFDLENQIISGAYNVFGCDEGVLNPKFLDALFKTKKFLDFVSEKANGGVRMDFKIEYMQEWQIPLPPIETQNEIVEKVEKQKQIIEGVEKIDGALEINTEMFEDESWDTVLLSDVCKFSGGSQPAKDLFIYEPKTDYVRLVQIRDFKSDKFVTYVKKDSVTKFFKQDDVMIARYGPPVFQILRGLEGAYNVALMKAIPDETRISKDYLYYFLQNKEIQNYVIDNSQRSAGQSGVNTDLLNSYQIFLPSLKIQQQIVERLDRRIRALEGTQLLKSEAQSQIENTVTKVWNKND
jgi:type I restriction-modification system DNA methylase subunit/restriction endonuclease S subunit